MLTNSHNKEREKIIADFNKYANFISIESKVNIVLNGIEAKTDGQTITLPDLLSLSPREIQFLYGVLTHEVGHVEFTDFSKEKFKQIKSESHFMFVNSLEDARIENCMMKKYDGAHEIFNNLYNNFVMDKYFMKKNFGFTIDEADLLKAIGLYLHIYFINLKFKEPLKKRLGTKLSKQVLDFIKKHDLDNYLSTQNLNSWNDVIRISDYVYNLYFAKKNDTSDVNFIPQMEKSIDSILNDDLISMRKDYSEFREEQNEIYKQIQPIQKKLNEVYKENKDQLDALNKQENEITETLNKINDFDNIQREIDSLNKILQAQGEKNTKKEDQVNNILDKIASISNKLSELDAKPENEEVIQKLNNSLEKQIESLLKADELSDKYSSNLNQSQKELQDQIKQYEKLKQELKIEDIPQFKDQLNQDLEKVKEELNTIHDKMRPMQTEINELQQKMYKHEEDFNSKMGQKVKELQLTFNKEGIPVNLIPKFEDLEGWDEANDIQKEFDARAEMLKNEIVVNGTGIGQGGRDILMVIQDTSNQLQEIDLAKVFKDRYKFSKFDSLNEFAEINNTTEIETDEETLNPNSRMHIPLTKEFDKIIFSNTKNDSINQIRKEHFKIIKKTKEIFAYKMKSRKRDHFKGNKEEGSLDTRNLWKLATRRDNHYFEINQPKPINDVVASIALDVSGSMDKEASESGKKVKELCTFLSDALKEVFVKHEICAFHAPINHEMRKMKKSSSYNRISNNLETIVYKKFTDNHNENISGIELKCSDNSDGESIKLIATRLIKERAKRRVMFIISDNKPFLTEADVSTLDNDLQNTIRWCIQNRVEIYAFGFNNLGEKFYKQNYCNAQNYDDFIKFCQQKIVAK